MFGVNIGAKLCDNPSGHKNRDPNALPKREKQYALDAEKFGDRSNGVRLA